MILIAIGSNLPARTHATALTTCRDAVCWLGRLPDLRLAASSAWYDSDPVPPSGQPPYVNGVVRLDGDADPAALLGALQAIEAAFGRRRGAANAARTLDLDILAIGSLVRPAPDPIVPHPRLHERAFVLLPLLDVAPEWHHPILRRSAQALLAGLPPQGVRRIGPSHLRDGVQPPR